MNTRFRVRFRDGGDATIGSLEAFFDLVQSDGITADDLIHDALTGEWVPAKAHPVYWLCTDPHVALAEGSIAPRVPEQALALAGPPPELNAPTADVPELDLTLAEPAPEPTPEEAASEFVRKMDEERAADPDLPQAIAELAVLQDGVAVLDTGPAVREEPTPAPQDEPTPAPRDEPVPGAQDDPTAGDGRVEELEDDWYKPTYRMAEREPRSLQVSLTVALVLGSAGIAGGVGLAWPDLGSVRDTDEATAVVSTRRVNATEEELRSTAYESFLDEVARLGEGVGIGPVPEVWLEGRYLADAAAYASVGAYWTRYRDYVEVVRNRDDEFYRAAYLETLEGAGVSGPVRSLRLATAVADFSARRVAREAVYNRVAALADAALELHQLSTAARGRISYEPARANRVSADPVIEAAGRDAQMQDALDASLDRVLQVLHGEVGMPGPGREGVETWLAEALKAPATLR